ncbi:MAG TPA: heme ABC transporter ATP-binding protein [Syntrophomonadaceae bacterium]|nr:heme ABC transporter ATP-binding protein [Syntrophomonadaceae bacterium]
MLLELMGVCCEYGSVPVLADVNLVINQGDILGIIGPNGSGKSTLLRTMSRVLPPRHGSIMMQERDLYKIPAQQAARQLAFVSQETGVDFPFTVEEVVLMGRIPHLKRFQKEGAQDWEVVHRALDLTGTSHLAGRPVNELSGGERQRVLIARALAQEPRVLFLDEPTSFLDLNFQIEIMELLKRLRHEQGLTVVMVVHDLNLACHYCDSLLVLKEGRIFTAGSPDKVISAHLIQEVYGCQVRVEYRHPGVRPTIVLQPSLAEAGPESGASVHIVGGGGAGGSFFHYLIERGWKVSTGVINIGDSDWMEAVHLGIEAVEASPFCPIGREEKIRNRDLMHRADCVLLTGIPFGSGNLPNLEAVLEEAQEGKWVIVIDNQDIEQRDYTDGKASELYRRLLETGVHVARNESEARRMIEEASSHGRERQTHSDYRGSSQR